MKNENEKKKRSLHLTYQEATFLCKEQFRIISEVFPKHRNLVIKKLLVNIFEVVVNYFLFILITRYVWKPSAAFTQKEHVFFILFHDLLIEYYLFDCSTLKG